VLVVVLLSIFGLVMVLSASSIEGVRDGTPWYFFNRQAMYTAVGMVALVVAGRVDYHRWLRIAPAGYVVSVLMLLALFFTGRTINGSTRWLGLGPFAVQPSEIAKLTVLIAIAAVLSAREREMGDRRRTLHLALLLWGPIALMILMQPDLGTTIILTVVALSAPFIAGVPLRPMFGLAGIGAVAVFALALVAPYRRDRLLAFRQPWDHLQDIGWQTVQSYVGLANGGLWGTGLGESRAKWGYLPNAHSDFIFAIIGEELGFVGALIVMGLFLALGMLGFRAARFAPDLFGTLMAGGITCWFLLQFFVNVGGVVGIMPITGVTLPFVSFGGTSLIVNMAAAGILVNVASQGRAPWADAAGAGAEPGGRRRRPGRAAGTAPGRVRGA
jgi:cell division protein FtsW